jgi:8-oxo-dGTP diphosphatase
MTRYAFIIGRFQCAELTEGHRALIDEVSNRHGEDNVYILLGDRKTPPTKANPLSFELRRELVRAEYPSATVLRLWDTMTNEEWSDRLDKLVDSLAGRDATLYSGRDSFIPHYTGTYKTVLIETGITCSATEHREWCGANRIHNHDFRAGVIHAQFHGWHKTYETVDVALLRRDIPSRGIQVLLGQKPFETTWRFPGGFIDAGETTVQAAARELQEETGLDCEPGLVLVQDFVIRDWRLRDVSQKEVTHKTFLCAGWYMFGAPKAGDDLAKVRWFDLKEVYSQADAWLTSTHRPLVEAVWQFAQITKEPVDA